jgi:hypothetical protein
MVIQYQAVSYRFRSEKTRDEVKASSLSMMRSERNHILIIIPIIKLFNELFFIGFLENISKLIFLPLSKKKIF